MTVDVTGNVSCEFCGKALEAKQQRFCSPQHAGSWIAQRRRGGALVKCAGCLAERWLPPVRLRALSGREYRCAGCAGDHRAKKCPDCGSRCRGGRCANCAEAARKREAEERRLAAERKRPKSAAGTRVHVRCRACGGERDLAPSAALRFIFCSKTCEANARRKLPQLFRCEFCGGEFPNPGKTSAEKPPRFCSPEHARLGSRNDPRIPRFEAFGVQLTMRQVCATSGRSAAGIKSRISRGMSLEQAMLARVKRGPQGPLGPRLSHRGPFARTRRKAEQE